MVFSHHWDFLRKEPHLDRAGLHSAFLGRLVEGEEERGLHQTVYHDLRKLSSKLESIKILAIKCMASIKEDNLS